MRHPLPLIILVLLCSCKKNSTSSPQPTVSIVDHPIKGASGIADSKANPGYVWVEEDRFHPAQVWLMGYDGKVAKKILIKDAFNNDWEDMALSGNDLYIGGIGDNELNTPTHSFIIFPEPSVTTDTVSNYTTVSFQYPDGNHDAEAFLVDPQSKDIFIITKRDDSSRIYRLVYPYSTSSVNTTTLAGKLPYNIVTGAAMAPDGSGLIVRTYLSLNYYKRSAGESIDKVLQKSYTALPYKMEQQGEAVTFKNDMSGYFTLSETNSLDSIQRLYFYKF